MFIFLTIIWIILKLKIIKGENIMKNIEKFFDEIDLHDAPLKRLEYNFDEDSILFEFLEVDEQLDEFKSFILIFRNIKKFTTNDDGSERFIKNGIEVLSADCTQIGENIFEIIFLFLLDTGAEYIINIVFEDLEYKAELKNSNILNPVEFI